MRQRKPCEFFLIRYVPDPIRNEFVNIGVLVRNESEAAQTPMLRFTRDWSRVRCIDPDADTSMLEALEGELQARLSEGREHGMIPVLKMISDSFSNSLQITDAKGCLAESVLSEVEDLMRVYVDPHKRKTASRRGGRARIQAALRGNFERAHVWHLLQKRIPASLYTQPGDPLTIDCGYRPNGVVKMFHAVSLESDVEAAKAFAFSASRLRDGVQRIEAADLQLTAIVEPIAQLRVEDDEDVVTQYRFGVEAMEAQQIRVLTTNDLSRLSDAARRDLRVE